MAMLGVAVFQGAVNVAVNGKKVDTNPLHSLALSISTPFCKWDRILSSFAAVPGREGWLVPCMAGGSTRSRQELPLVFFRDVIVSAHSLAE